jgi:hypothetical protein
MLPVKGPSCAKETIVSQEPSSSSVTPAECGMPEIRRALTGFLKTTLTEQIRYQYPSRLNLKRLTVHIESGRPHRAATRQTRRTEGFQLECDTRTHPLEPGLVHTGVLSKPRNQLRFRTPPYCSGSWGHPNSFPLLTLPEEPAFSREKSTDRACSGQGRSQHRRSPLFLESPGSRRPVIPSVMTPPILCRVPPKPVGTFSPIEEKKLGTSKLSMNWRGYPHRWRRTRRQS